MVNPTSEKIPQHELAADVDSYRMGLWWLMMHRSQGHLAHAVLKSGLVLMQRLWMVCSWDDYDRDEFVSLHDAGRAFFETMMECVAVIGDKGQMGKYRAKVEEMGKRLYDMQRLREESRGPIYRGHGKAIAEYRSRRGWAKLTRHTMKSMPPVGPLKPIQGELCPPEQEQP